MSLCDGLENFVRFPQRDTLYLRATFAQKIVLALLLREKWHKKKKSKSESKIPKIVGEKRNFSPFRTGSEIADLLGRLTIINVQRRIFSVWLKRLWSEDGSSLSSRPSNRSIGDKLSLSACKGAQTYLLKPYDSDRILTRQASSTWNGIKANMLHRKFCSLLIDGVITLSIK